MWKTCPARLIKLHSWKNSKFASSFGKKNQQAAKIALFFFANLICLQKFCNLKNHHPRSWAVIPGLASSVWLVWRLWFPALHPCEKRLSNPGNFYLLYFFKAEWAMKNKHLLFRIYRGWETTQINGDYDTSKINYKDPQQTTSDGPVWCENLWCSKPSQCNHIFSSVRSGTFPNKKATIKIPNLYILFVRSKLSLSLWDGWMCAGRNGWFLP